MARVLISDDSLLARLTLQDIVEAAGHETILAASGQECIELATAEAPDCILLDLLVPDVAGQETLSILRGLGVAAPVIVVTSDVQESTRQYCLSAGADEVLHKPVRQEQLARAIGCSLARAANADSPC